MSKLLYEQKSFEKLASLLNFAKSFVFKDLSSANALETSDSIELSSYYISAKFGMLPYLTAFSKQGFPESLNDFNLMTDGVTFYKEAFELNSKYVYDSDTRYKEVRSSLYNTNSNKVDPPFKGNIFELNAYYRHLYCELGVEIDVSRRATDYEILYYDSSFASDSLDIPKFLDLYNENCAWFINSMENKAFNWDPRQRVFNTWFITISAIFSYLDADMEKPFDVDSFDQYDIRNMLYSFNVTFINDLPAEYQLRVIKNIRSLIKAKGTNAVFDIIIKDIFGYGTVDIYKYYLIKDYGTSVSIVNDFYNKTKTLFEVLSDASSDPELYFIRVPYTVANIDSYLATNAIEDKDKLPFSDVINADKYWSKESASEEILQSSNFKILQTKYIDINTTIDYVPDVEGLLLFFSMLHDSEKDFPLIYNNIGDEDISVFQSFVAMFYILYLLSGDETSPVIPPQTKILSNKSIGAVLACCLASDYATDHSLTLEVLNLPDNELKDLMNFANDFENLPSLKLFSQSFKNNFELLKLLSRAMRFTAYTGTESVGHNISYEDGIGNTVFKTTENSPLPLEVAGTDPDYAEKLIEILEAQSVSLNSRNVRSIRNILELRNIRETITSFFEERTKFGNKYGTGLATVDKYLKDVCPVLYTKITEQFTEGTEQSQRELLNNLCSDISLSLKQIFTRFSPSSSVFINLTEDVNFKTISHEFIVSYATKLIEYYISYTIQIRSQGVVYNMNDPGPNTVQIHDNLDWNMNRKEVTTDYLWTGKNPYPLEVPDLSVSSNKYYDSERHGFVSDPKDGIIYANIIDDIGRIKASVLLNTKDSKTASYNENGSVRINADLVSVPSIGAEGLLSEEKHNEKVSFRETLYARMKRVPDYSSIPESITSIIDANDIILVINGLVYCSGQEENKTKIS